MKNTAFKKKQIIFGGLRNKKKKAGWTREIISGSCPGLSEQPDHGGSQRRDRTEVTGSH